MIQDLYIALYGHKTSLNKFQNIAIIPSIFSDYNALKSEINCKKEAKKGSTKKEAKNIAF